MAGHGLRLKAGELWSIDFPQAIERPDGSLRIPYIWNGRHTNRYVIRLQCEQCGVSYLAERSRTRTAAFCSKRCGMLHRAETRPIRRRKGNRSNDKRGNHILIQAPNHPFARKGFVPEHRLIVEREIGRILLEKEVVHHIDLIRDNNTPDNLVTCKTDAAHRRVHATLNDCVAELMAMGVLSFDKHKLCYYVTRIST
jgi:hypothetical protein